MIGIILLAVIGRCGSSSSVLSQIQFSRSTRIVEMMSGFGICSVRRGFVTRTYTFYLKYTAEPVKVDF